MAQQEDTITSCTEKSKAVADDMYLLCDTGKIQAVWSFQEKALEK